VKPSNHSSLQSVKFLGVLLDSQLTWTPQCTDLLSRLSQQLFLIRSLKGNVSTQTLMSVYHGCFYSILTYGILAWGHSSAASTIFGIQRRCIRILYGLKYRDECRHAFQDLGILTLPGVYIAVCLCHVKENLDLYPLRGETHDYLTLKRSCLSMKPCRLKRSQDGKNYWGAKLFNSLPTAVQDLPLPTFKKKITELLLKLAVYSTQEFLDLCATDINV